jgi:hypothetical protein
VKDLDLQLLGAAMAFREHFGPLDVETLHLWSWRAVPFGPCPRCRWPAHTLGPNGSPFHPFCWGNPDPVPWWSDFVLRQVRAGEWA